MPRLGVYILEIERFIWGIIHNIGMDSNNRSSVLKECRGMRVRTLNKTLLKHELEVWQNVEHDMDVIALRNDINTISIFNILDIRRKVLYHVVVNDDTGELIEFRRLTE